MLSAFARARGAFTGFAGSSGWGSGSTATVAETAGEGGVEGAGAGGDQEVVAGLDTSPTNQPRPAPTAKPEARRRTARMRPRDTFAPSGADMVQDGAC